MEKKKKIEAMSNCNGNCDACEAMADLEVTVTGKELEEPIVMEGGAFAGIVAMPEEKSVQISSNLVGKFDCNTTVAMVQALYHLQLQLVKNLAESLGIDDIAALVNDIMGQNVLRDMPSTGEIN